MTYGLNMQFDYKGFSLTALFQGASLFNNNVTDILRGALQNDANAYEFHYKYTVSRGESGRNQGLSFTVAQQVEDKTGRKRIARSLHPEYDRGIFKCGSHHE